MSRVSGYRDLLYQLGSRSLTKMLTLQDRNPHSPTYGCFDRNFWHFRITDFPSGMAQEFVLPLALAYADDFPGNRFFGNEAIRESVRAGIAYAARSAHEDGSCDDYYPFEKAAGAAAFSLYAALRAIPLARLDFADFANFLKRRGTWLGDHRESGRLSNHEALIANNLFRLALLSGETSYTQMAQRRLARLLAWQAEEGWFYEYQGCDPGYMTLTIANLAEIDEMHPSLGLREPIRRAVKFLLALQPPDGWLGGEWTCRNTNNYFPHGLELCGAWLSDALVLNARAVEALRDAPDYEDDHILAHHAWSYLLAARSWKDLRPESAEPVSYDCRIYFPEAGYLKIRKGRFSMLVSLKKGGTFRLYEGDRLVYSDTGISLLVNERSVSVNYVCHLWSDKNDITLFDDGVTVSGSMGRAKATQMTPLKNVVLRCLMLTLGRLNPDLIRRLLQRLLITGDSRTHFVFHRSMNLDSTHFELTDRVSGKGDVIAAGVGPAQTSIYTVMSRVFHHPQLQPWEELTDALERHGSRGVTLSRHFRYPS